MLRCANWFAGLLLRRQVSVIFNHWTRFYCHCDPFHFGKDILLIDYKEAANFFRCLLLDNNYIEKGKRLILKFWCIEGLANSPEKNVKEFNRFSFDMDKIYISLTKCFICCRSERFSILCCFRNSSFFPLLSWGHIVRSGAQIWKKMRSLCFELNFETM